VTDFDAMFAADQLPALYATFGKDATVQRGVAAPVDLRVIVNRASESVGDFGTVVARVDRLQCQATAWKPAAGDIVRWVDHLGSHEKKVEGEAQAITSGLEYEAVLHG
jgi:hypothetical protein